ncbi:GINS complex protein-domain-containing protein [Morchella snyderi]|nr:GINS complex protein-domain-containing protein [Morchella snyderi]
MTSAGSPLPGTGPLTPSEIAFLAESEPITIIPRQRLDRLPLISGTLPAFHPPQRATVPLWLALLLKRQRRCNIVPPPWLTPSSLDAALKREADSPFFSAAQLPFRWLETATLLLAAAPDDVGDDVRVALRELREARQRKVREGVRAGGVEGTYVMMNGLGAMEIAEVRGFVGGVVDGVRRIGGSREEGRRRAEEERGAGRRGGEEEDEEEEVGY